MTEIDAVGVIGIGHIGKGFIDRLAGTDYSIVGYDVAEEPVEYAIEQGGTGAASPVEVVERVDCVLLALPGTPEVEATMDGEDGILAVLEAGQVVVDATTTRAETSRSYGRKCAEAGAAYLDAPITGGSPREGMHVMVGGSEDDYAAARPVLDVLCEDHTRIGAAGDATVFKLGLQIRYAGHEAVDAEVMEFLRDNGVDPDPLWDFLAFDLSERYRTREFGQEIEGLGGLAIWHKDVGYAREVARENDTALPLNGVVHEAYKATMRRNDDGEDEGDSAQLLTYWELLNDAGSR